MVNKLEKVIQNKFPVDDWNFASLKQSERQYGVHFFHHYTAKFIPQIPARIINRLGNNGCVIVDPFMGSGTTLVESKMLGFDSYGLDTNPLAVKITQSKTMELNKKQIDEIDCFLKWLEDNKNKEDKLVSNSYENSLFPNSHLWFRNDVACKISLIISEIENYSSGVKNFIEIGLSTLLKGMSNARMDSVTPILPNNHIYIDRKHYYREVNNLTRKIPVFRRMFSQIRRMRTAIIEFNKNSKKGIICAPILSDARILSDSIKQCDLIITSPPYWSAQNYEKLHMLSFKLFQLEIEDGDEIGRNNSSYLNDMNIVFTQIARILNGYFALVIGEDTKNYTNERLYNIAKDTGFRPVETIARNISNHASRAKQIKREFIYIFKV